MVFVQICQHLVKPYHFIHNNLDNKYTILGIFLDLIYCGIRGKALLLLKSFISNRPQKVWLNNNDCIITFSVFQGTVLSLILFIIYINGLLNINLDAVDTNIVKT